MVHTCSPSIFQAKAEGSKFQGYPEINRKKLKIHIVSQKYIQLLNGKRERGYVVSFGGHLPFNLERLTRLSKMEYLSLGNVTGALTTIIIFRKPLVSCHLDMPCYCGGVVAWK